VACAEGSIQGDDPSLVERDYAQHAVISVATPAKATATAPGSASPRRARWPCCPAARLRHRAHRQPRRSRRPDGPRRRAYLARLQAHFGERLRFASVGPRARYPLLLRYRPDPVGQRTVWLGNAAQTLHPVAGQGYNLALRDVWACAQVLLRAGGDPGAADTLAAYARERRLDRQGTIRFTDGLVRLFSNAVAPLAPRAAPACSPSTCCRGAHFVAKRMMFGARAWP
jgi:2-octaprenyl-6-methoxyphenol hydroxylase